nr:leucine-rich repeat domain-containing protein [Ruminiclostridium sp.]
SSFEDCSSLKTLTLSNALASVGAYAFRRCTALESVSLPNSVTRMGEGAFEECTGLKTLNLSTGLTRLEDFAFYRCSMLYPLNLPENLTEIGRYTFAECTALSSVTIPKSVTIIGASAFENCSFLAVAIIPNTTQFIYPTAFHGAPVSIYGYTGTYAEQFARENSIPFTSYGSVYNVTFSADIYNATVDNISIKTPSGTLVPPTTVQNDESLTITITAPDGFIIDHITINGELFTNGTTYRVNNRDVNIFASYKRREETTTSATTPPPPDTTPAPVTTRLPDVTTVTVDPGKTPVNDDSYVTVDSDLEGVGGKNVRIIAQRGDFTGSAVVRLTNTPAASEAAQRAAEKIAGKGTMYYYGFDISLLDENGREDPGIMSGGAITFQVPVPVILEPYMDSISVYHVSGSTPEPISSSIVEDQDGTKRVQFDASSFSPYMFVAEPDEESVDPEDEEETVNIDEDSNDGNNTDDRDDTDNGAGSDNGNNAAPVTIIDDNGNDPEIIISREETTKPAAGGTSGGSKPVSGNTGGGVRLNPGTGALLFIGIPAASLGCALLVRRKRKEKRVRTKNDIK